jgi:Ca2+-binding EF-hand superfamily protein
MKRPGLTPSLLSATLFLIVSSATALSGQDMMAATPPTKAAKRADELLKRFDKNADGKLDDDERADAKERMLTEQVDRQMARAAALPGGLEQFRSEALQMFDQNRDGRLDEEERAAAQKFADMRHSGADDSEGMRKQFDKNGDGKIDAEERATIESYLSALRGLGALQARSELLRRFDQNANGKIDEGEFDELEKFVRPRVEASPAQLRRHDANHDGKLDDAEWESARTLITQWLTMSGSAPFDGDSMVPGISSMRGMGDDAVNSRAAERERELNTSIPPAAARPTSEVEQARLKAVGEEVLRRRAERGTAPSKLAPK